MNKPALKTEPVAQTLSGTHLTAQFNAPRSIVFAHQPMPEPAANEILVAIEGCGVCASSLPSWQGRPWLDYPLPPGNPGHEPWGSIVACGPQVVEFVPGERVAFLADQGYAQFACVAQDRAVRLPAALNGLPFPGEAIGCAMNIFSRADIQAGQQVAIIGAGFLGLLLVQLATAAGATVHVFSRRKFARKQAKRFGATTVWDTEDWWGNAHRLVEHTGGVGCARVIEVTGLAFALDTATVLIGEYGRLVIAGFHQDGLRNINMQTWNWRAIDVINAHERSPERYRQGMQAAVEATVSGRITPHNLLTDVFPLAELERAFMTLEERQDGFIKAWVRL